MNNSNHSNSSETGSSGYSSDLEEEVDERSKIVDSVESVLNSMIAQSDDDDDDDDSSAIAMPPPSSSPLHNSTTTTHTSTSSLSSSNNSDDGNLTSTVPNFASFSPLSNSPGSESPPSSDEERWEMHYLSKKRRLLSKAYSMMNREKVYDASMALSNATQTSFDTPLWMEAAKTVHYNSEVKHSSSTEHQQHQNKRPRIDLSCVYHVKTAADDFLVPQMCTVHHKTPVSVSSSDAETEDESETMDLARAIAFSPIAQ